MSNGLRTFLWLDARPQLGEIELANPIVMAPMTRDRSGAGDVPTSDMAEYYRQRAGAGLIVTEGTQPSPEGKGYWRTPGIYSEAQVAGWARVAEAVHAEGGRIVMQLMHCGRVVVAANRGFEADVVAPSALPCPDPVPGPDGVPATTAAPRALDEDDIEKVAAQFARAALNARAAGLDGVELHCASGYLVNQFLNPASNRRSDGWGGDADKRARFPVLVVKALADAIGAGRVGIRISPGNPYNGMDVSDPASDFAPFLAAVDPLGLAYLHLLDMSGERFDAQALVRAHWSGPVILNNMLTPASAKAALEEGRAAAVSFGRAFIANPDLVARLRAGAPLAKPDYARLYTGEAAGYIDYPRWTP
jgi:N-ethylmaleimide reductase